MELLIFMAGPWRKEKRGGYRLCRCRSSLSGNRTSAGGASHTTQKHHERMGRRREESGCPTGEGKRPGTVAISGEGETDIAELFPSGQRRFSCVLIVMP